MNKPLSQIEREIIERTRQARIGAGLTQAAIAHVLGIGQGTYKNYEVDRCLPPELVATFCIAARCDAGWLFGVPGAQAPANLKPVRPRTPRARPADPPKRSTA